MWQTGGAPGGQASPAAPVSAGRRANRLQTSKEGCKEEPASFQPRALDAKLSPSRARRMACASSRAQCVHGINAYPNRESSRVKHAAAVIDQLRTWRQRPCITARVSMSAAGLQCTNTMFHPMTHRLRGVLAHYANRRNFR